MEGLMDRQPANGNGNGTSRIPTHLLIAAIVALAMAMWWLMQTAVVARAERDEQQRCAVQEQYIKLSTETVPILREIRQSLQQQHEEHERQQGCLDRIERRTR